jgi:3'-phosphoadenosine 5'-phosphosulfate sulfotransferase (PAPS reductase)/FAD synthetase
MRLDYRRWRSLQGYGAFSLRTTTEPTYIQFSGGRTSAFMLAMAPDEVVPSFQNTGREHTKTLDFVERVGDAVQKEIVWLEFRPPKHVGDPPKAFGWERVSHRTASRRGEPFQEFMLAINAYRKACGNPQIAPWVNGRICTTHLKHRVLDHYLKGVGVDGHDRWVGLRADELHRVAGLRRQETTTRTLTAPLADAGVIKANVNEFWSWQPFDLGIEEYDGNCDGCFLKDQADLSRSLGRRSDTVSYWADLQDTYPRFGGVKLPSYRQLAAELPVRLAIEDALRAGQEPPPAAPGADARRHKLVVIQERKRFENGPGAFSCACEASMDPEDEEAA